MAALLEQWETSLGPQLSDEDFLEVWAKVAAELHSLVGSPAATYLESEEGVPFDGRLAQFQRRLLFLSERGESEALLRGASRNGPFGRNTFDRLREAAELVDLAAFRNGVVVGCGPFPAAALFLHEHTRNLSITGLEIDPAAAQLARRVCDLHCLPRLEIVCGDGCDHDYEGADFVYVVNQATPKREILRRVASTAPSGVVVLARDPVGPGRLLAESVDRSLPAPWHITAAGAPDPNFLSRHLLLAAAR
jgi:hypothetical protein